MQEGKTLILIVDDLYENCLLLDYTLKKKGYRTMIAHNGYEAFDCMNTEKPDLIISDILMPVMDGFVFCRKCKSDNRYASIPFIFYTATYTSSKDEEFALSLGADMFIVKPAEPNVFLKYIADVLEKYKKGELQTREICRLPEDEQFMKDYNVALIRKIEDKLEDAEKARKLIQQRENLLRAILNSSPDIVLLIDEEGLFHEVTTTDETFLYKPAYEVKGKKVTDIFEEELSRKLLNIINETVKTQKVQSIKYPLKMSFGERWYEAKLSPVKDYNLDGKQILTVLIRDITEYKALENELKMININLADRIEEEIKRRRQQEQIIIQQALFSAMSEMLISISHHWRQPLNVIGLLLQNQKDDFERGTLTVDKVREYVDIAMERLKALSTTIDDFLNLLKANPEEKVFDVKPPVVNVINLFKPQFDEDNIICKMTCLIHNLEVKDSICCDDMLIKGDISRFQDCIVRIINNAIQAIKEARKKGLLKINEEGLINISFTSSNGLITVSIDDNGCGIPSKILDRIFDPYFTTNEKYYKQGIGLYIVKMLVERLFNGSITARNLNKGASFALEFQQTK